MDSDMKMLLAIIALIIMAIFAFSGDDVLNEKRDNRSAGSETD
jgi:hypothetical protein